MRRSLDVQRSQSGCKCKIPLLLQLEVAQCGCSSSFNCWHKWKWMIMPSNKLYWYISPLYTWNCFHWLIYVCCKVKLSPNYKLVASVKQSHKSHIRHDSIWIPYPWIISLGYEKGPFVSVKSMPSGLTCNITWTLSITKYSKFVYLYWFSRSFNHT